MKLNKGKYHLVILEHKHEKFLGKNCCSKIWESNRKKLLGVQIDINLSYDEHVSNLYKKAGENVMPV